jgi:hypothetical protein
MAAKALLLGGAGPDPLDLGLEDGDSLVGGAEATGGGSHRVDGSVLRRARERCRGGS